MKMNKLFFFASIISATIGTVHAGIVYETSALGELTGSRDSGLVGGVDILTGGDLSSFLITWAITPVAGHYHYVYELSGTTGPALGISHFALELSSTCTAGSTCISNATVNSSDVQSALNFGVNSSDNGDPGLPTAFYGVRFAPVVSSTQLPITVAFDSDRTPIYGDFYVKAGQGVVGHGGAAWNSGNTSANNSTAAIDFIPRPDTGTVNESATPEPASFLLLGGGLVALGLVRRRQRR
jgi:PEP-CTERM motif